MSYFIRFTNFLDICPTNICFKVDNVKEDKFQGQSEVYGVKLKLVGRPGGKPAQPEELEKAFEHDGREEEKTMRKTPWKLLELLTAGNRKAAVSSAFFSHLVS